MKSKKPEIQKEIEKTTAYFDLLDRIEPNPYFFTRLEARLDAGPESRTVFKGALQSVWVTALILINLVSIIVFWSDNRESATTRELYLQEVASDLTINQSYIDPFEQNN